MKDRLPGAGVFVTGTDTGAGKTVIACMLLRQWVSKGKRAVGMKPVAAGIAAGAAGNEDVTALEAAGNVDAPLAARNPFAFAPPIAPHLAAAEAGTVIELEPIRAAYDRLAVLADRIVVEGAGGVWAPLDARHDMLDIARALSLPVLLVVAVRLGCLNHALLSAHAIHTRGLIFAGWVANLTDPAMPRVAPNLDTLEARLPAPRIATVGWDGAEAPQWGPGAAALGLD